MGVEKSEQPDEGNLQFDKAEYASAAHAGAICTSCRKEIRDEYYEVNGQVVCGICCDSIDAHISGGSPLRRIVLAAVYGLAAGVLGAFIYYAVIAVTHLEIGLISILVGYMVGKAVSLGSEGRGGVFYQALAMFITYSSIVFSYVLPDIIKHGIDYSDGIGRLLVAIYTEPFRDGAQNILGIIIIGIGLYEAFAINRAPRISITGPYQIAGSGGPPA